MKPHHMQPHYIRPNPYCSNIVCTSVFRNTTECVRPGNSWVFRKFVRAIGRTDDQMESYFEYCGSAIRSKHVVISEKRLSLGVKAYFNTTVWGGADRKSKGYLDDESAGCPSFKALFLSGVVRLIVGYKRLTRTWLTSPHKPERCRLTEQSSCGRSFTVVFR